MSAPMKSLDKFFILSVSSVALLYLLYRTSKQFLKDGGAKKPQTIPGTKTVNINKDKEHEKEEAINPQTSQLTPSQANRVKKLLNDADDPATMQNILDLVLRLSSFTCNQKVFRDAGILQVMMNHLNARHQYINTPAKTSHGENSRGGSRGEAGRSARVVGKETENHASVITSITRAITNLSTSEGNQQQLQECIPVLIDFVLSPSSTSDIQLSSLQALTNLSLMPAYHRHFTPLIEALYQYMNNSINDTLKLQAAKILVNLSCNPDMVSHLLAAKAPTCFMDLLLATHTSEDILLRWITHLAYVTMTAHKKRLTNTSLPTQYKAASPETMYTAIYGLSNSVTIRSKLYVLTKHHNTDICQQASRVYNAIV